MLFRLHAFIQRLTRHRSTRLTSEGVQFLLFTLAVGIAAINTGNNLFYLLLSMMLSIILMSGIVAEHCLRRLEFHRHLPDLLFVHEAAAATLVIRNGKSRWPSFSLRLFDVIDGHDVDRGLTVRQLLPGGSQLLSYPLVAAKRGRLRLDGIRVVTSFPFGLFLKKAYYPIEGMTVVCPALTPLPEELVHHLAAAGHEHHVSRRGHGHDLYNLRLYHSGDDSRNIHWVTTAKTSKLIVRETEAEEQRRATIHLSTWALPEHEAPFEEAVTFTASLITHLSDRGYHLRVVIGGVASHFGLGEMHRLTLLQSLALCERRSPGSEESSPVEWDDTDGFEPGADIVIRPSTDGNHQHARHPTILIDGTPAAGASHVF
jgi:uncharacterized protein (DUF58 family)